MSVQIIGEKQMYLKKKMYSPVTTFREVHKYPWALCLPAVSLEKLPKSVRLTGNSWELTALLWYPKFVLLDRMTHASSSWHDFPFFCCRVIRAPVPWHDMYQVSKEFTATHLFVNNPMMLQLQYLWKDQWVTLSDYMLLVHRNSTHEVSCIRFSNVHFLCHFLLVLNVFSLNNICNSFFQFFPFSSERNYFFQITKISFKPFRRNCQPCLRTNWST